MFNSLLRPSKRRRIRDNHSPYASTRNITLPTESPQDRNLRLYHDNERSGSEEDDEGYGDDEEDGESPSEDEDEESPLLPIFSSAHLDALPVYTLTHIFRMMIVSRCDTVLSWEQLRSPQVSQFLIKPIQQEIKENHFGPATECALMANCLQFMKEVNLNPGNSGTNRTRAMICELLAIKILREYSTRELIDALSYDFDPLQGQNDVENNAVVTQQIKKPPRKSVRISCLEIALRAQSKRFLAHPLIVRHLEAIWNGSIVFHAAADSMHRRGQVTKQTTYGTAGQNQDLVPGTSRLYRTVTLYNPQDASLFKLSRLRVPRYRNILSTVSFAVLLGLFLAVLIERNVQISTLEVIFWFWAAGYMLDEVIGFNEQGFSLYIASFWNVFDMGILLLLFVYLCLRLYGIIIPVDSKSKMAYRAYDILAADAVFLFPRLFSVLDHYRYFSQLIIAFRMMAADMIAIFVLIIIFCSGFMVALGLALGSEELDSPPNLAYALFQLFMGFTPAAWDRWAAYNWLGKTILALFLFICHFVIVTILVTVMTNSFMEIVRNANEEHQFLFALNTISSVKSDALFAYVPPANILQWILIPLRNVMPFRNFIKTNRTIIKVTHFPILFAIYFYERLILRTTFVDNTDDAENRGRVRQQLTQRLPRLMREPSIATFRQEAALEEVFRHPNDATLRSARTRGRKTSNVVKTWMNDIAEEEAEPPLEEDRRIVDRLERKRFAAKRFGSSVIRDFSATGRATSVASDPNDFTSHIDFFSPSGRVASSIQRTPSALDLPAQQTDGDGDDEVTDDNDNDNETELDNSHVYSSISKDFERLPQPQYFSQTTTPQIRTPEQASSIGSIAKRRHLTTATGTGSPRQASRRERRPQPHLRNVSSATMIFNPPLATDAHAASNDIITSDADTSAQAGHSSDSKSPSQKPIANAAGRKTPKRQFPSHIRPLLPTKEFDAFRSTPDFSALLQRNSTPTTPPTKRRSSLEMDLVSDIGDNKAIGGGYVGAIPASFATQMAMATGAIRQSQLQQQRNEDSEMFGRLMMARMNSLEEGFREVVHEVRQSIKQTGSSRQRSPERPIPATPLRVQRERERKRREAEGDKEKDAASRLSSERPQTGESGSNKENQRPVTSTEESGPHQELGDPAEGKVQVEHASRADL